MGNEERQRTFHVHEALLRYTSKVFSAALNHERSLGEHEHGVLKYPEDVVGAWEVLLFWMITKKLPDDSIGSLSVHDRETLQLSLVQCWTLGDKYGIPEFQDLVMLELLDLSCEGLVTVQAAEEAFENTSPRSRIRKLFSRLIVTAVVIDQAESVEEFEDLEGLPGYTADLLEAMQLGQPGDAGWAPLRWLMRTRGGRDSGEWKEYLVGDGPSQHWVFTADPRERLP